MSCVTQGHTHVPPTAPACWLLPSPEGVEESDRFARGKLMPPSKRTQGCCSATGQGHGTRPQAAQEAGGPLVPPGSVCIVSRRAHPPGLGGDQDGPASGPRAGSCQATQPPAPAAFPLDHHLCAGPCDVMSHRRFHVHSLATHPVMLLPRAGWPFVYIFGRSTCSSRPPTFNLGCFSYCLTDIVYISVF